MQNCVLGRLMENGWTNIHPTQGIHSFDEWDDCTVLRLFLSAINSMTIAAVIMIWAMPVIPEIAADALLDSSISRTCGIPRTKSIITINGRAAL